MLEANNEEVDDITGPAYNKTYIILLEFEVTFSIVFYFFISFSAVKL